MLDDPVGYVARTQLVEQIDGTPVRCRGESVEQARGGEQQRTGAHRGAECGVRMNRLQPATDHFVVDQLTGADTAGHHHHVRSADLVEVGITDYAEQPVLGAYLTAPMSDEDHVDRRDALQHFVGPDGVEGGEPVEQWDGDLHHASAVASS